jgi:cysteine-rich repeat protein
VCDGLDNDCDSVLPADEADGDNDGVLVCAGDCDDTTAAVSPNVPEVCDGLDNNCDTIIDNGATPGTWYPDYDSDGYGNPLFPIVTCNPAAGYVNNGSDCDDLNASNAPNATELCDGLDNDCDTVVDNGLSPQNPYYLDFDNDGYGDSASSITACALPPGYTTLDGDCNDTNSALSPAEVELCTDALDNDCDTLIDCDELVDCKPVESTCWVCGDTIQDPNETCDDGGFVNGDGCDEFCQSESLPIDLTGVYSQFPSGGRTVYFWQSNSNIPLNANYGTWCEDHGLSWYSPVSSGDAQNVIDTAYNYDSWHTWIITKTNTAAGTWGGFSVSVDNSSCSAYSSSGWSGIRKWACSYCDPETYDLSECWDTNHTYDWLVCEGP